VFQKPVRVKVTFQVWPMPANYRKANRRLPEQLKIWKVQKTTSLPNSESRPHGNVSKAAAFRGDRNAEILTYGVSTETTGPEAAIARHGNFLQWGYSASPSKMTEAGRRLFLNCVIYIKKFDGKRP